MKMKEENIVKGIRNGLCVLLAAGLVSCAGEMGDTAANDPEILGTTETEAVVGDDTWDANEFNTTFASNNYFEDWDLNDDNMLDENEYMGGFYDTWDMNNDNQIDENEWNTASNDWGLENNDWSTWDTSGDGILDENEFNVGFANNTWFDDWDMNDDSMLVEREYTDGVFGLWDENDDNMLDTNEFGAYNSYFGI